MWLQTSVVETATGLPVRWIGGVSNHTVDDSATNIDDHRRNSEALRTWSAASRVCSRAMMWSRLAGVPASSSESICDGFWSAPMGAAREDAGQWTADWNLSARLIWLLKVLRIASPTYRSTIDDDQRASDLICWMGTCASASKVSTTLSLFTVVPTAHGNNGKSCEQSKSRTLFRKDVVRSR